MSRAAAWVAFGFLVAAGCSKTPAPSPSSSHGPDETAAATAAASNPAPREIWIPTEVDSAATITPERLGAYLAGGLGIYAPLEVWKKETAIAKDLGIGTFRFNSDGWDVLEPTRGQFDWSKLDDIVEITRSAGLEMLFTLPITAKWNGSGETATVFGHAIGATHFPTRDMASYREFCSELAKRYKGRIRCYEVWNEPDFVFFWKGQLNPDAAEYLPFLQTAYETIKDADPSASVLIGGLAKPNDTAWLEKLLSLGGGKFFDVLNLHIYPAFGTFPSSIPKNRELLAKHGFSKPIWITETSTTGMYFETPDRAREEHNKAVYLAQNYSRAFSEPDVRRVFWHTLKNPGKDVRLARDLDFGLMDGEYRELPAFVAHRIWNSKLLGARAEGREAAATQDLEVYRFAAKTGPVWIAWSRTGESKFRPPSAAASFRVTSLFGEPSTVEAKTLSVTREPVYVEPTP